MSWKDQLQPASFRSIPFFVSDTEVVFGRRNVLHEYPLKDVPYAEDLGKKAREFTINAYIIGDDYITQRDQLIRVIENNNAPGVLIHPTLGIRNVVPTQCRVIFKNTEGGIEYLALTFVEAGINQYPSATTNTQENVQNTATQSTSDLQNSFSSLFNAKNVNDIILSSTKSLLVGTPSGVGGYVVPVSNSFIGTMNSIVSQGSYLVGATKQFSDLNAKITNFKNNIGTIIADAPTLASDVTDIIAGLRLSYPDDPNTQLKALLKLYNAFGVGIILISLSILGQTAFSVNRIQMVLNQQQLMDLIWTATLINMAISVSLMDFASRQDALNTMKQVETAMEPQLLSLADRGLDQAYNALNNSRVAMVQDIIARAATLKTVQYVSNNYQVPALVLAYKVYQDATQEADIIARNKIIKNPVFVPANQQIEVLV